MRSAIGASTGGPFSNSRSSIRAPGYVASSARIVSSSAGVRRGSYASVSTKSCPTFALRPRGMTL